MNKCKGFSKIWILGLLFVAFVAGCANNGDEIPVVLDTIAPTVTVTSPTNGAVAVPLNRKIGVALSEAMTQASIRQDSIALNETGIAGNLAGTVTRTSTSAIFAPTALLKPDTNYTVTVKGGVSSGVKDLAGNAMVNDYVFTFQTGLTADNSAPAIISTGVLDGATGLSVNRSSTATFSEVMDPATLESPATSFTVCATAIPGGPCVTPVVGVVTYLGNTATFNPDSNLTANTWYKSTISTKAEDLSGLALVSGLVPNSWNWQTGDGTLDTVAPKITGTNPAKLATNVPVNKKINATFNEAMNPATMITANFTVKKSGPPLGPAIAGTVAYDVQHNIVTFTPQNNLEPDTEYTVTITNGAKDLAGNALVVPAVDGLNPWTFKTAATPIVIPPTENILLTAAAYGTFGGSAGMTNTGTLTQIRGDIGTIATGTATVTGFHDTAGDIYTETPDNIGAVNGKIYSCTNSTTGPTSTGVNAVSCQIATQARLDAEAAYLALAARPTTADPGENLGGLTLPAGVYNTASGKFLIDGSDLTLDAGGDPNAVFVFQMSTTLTVGASSAPRSIILINGAQAKNVFWQVGSSATINPGGGGTMVGTIIAQQGVVFSTAGSVNILTLNGRALSLIASVTLVNTIINVPQ